MVMVTSNMSIVHAAQLYPEAWPTYVVSVISQQKNECTECEILVVQCVGRLPCMSTKPA